MKKFIKSIILIFITIHVAWSVYEYFWYSSLIPAKIEIAYAVNISGQSGLREGCGAAIFGITNATTDAISRQGIDFFNDAIYSRRSKDFRYTYANLTGHWSLVTDFMPFSPISCTKAQKLRLS